MRNFRLFLFGHLVSSAGTWMQQVGQDWLVLRLTNAPLPLGITLALQFAPMLAFGAWAGLSPTGSTSAGCCWPPRPPWPCWPSSSGS